MNNHVASPFREVLNSFLEASREAYSPNMHVNIVGTYPVAEIRATFTEMLDLFGCPLRTNIGSEINEWRFTGPGGRPFTIYDTGVPSETVKQEVEFFLGAESDDEGKPFILWVCEKLDAYRIMHRQRFLA